MLIGGVLLLIDLFLPWQDFGNEFSDAVGVDASFSGWRGVGGVLVGLLTIVLLAWLIVRLASVNVPLPVSTAMTAAIIGTLILIFTVIKLLTILGDEATIWAWVGLALAIVIAVGSFMTVQEAGGVETLRQEATTLSSSVGTSAPAAAGPAAAEPTSTPAPPPAPAEPTPAPAPPPAQQAPESAASEAPSSTLRRGGWGRGRSERRAVEPAEQLVGFSARNSAPARERAVSGVAVALARITWKYPTWRIREYPLASRDRTAAVRG